MTSDAEPEPEEALTKEEINGTASPPKPPIQNAFQKLMTPKRKREPSPPRSKGNPFKNRMGLGAYLPNPSSFPSSIVITHNADFVVIHDKYPKATIHTLLLPRSDKFNLMHPFDALADDAFRAKVIEETAKLKTLAAGELRRRVGGVSALDAAREAVLDGKVEGDDLPQGRNWEDEIITGVHAVPSMTHLHIHVLSRDMRSDSLRHSKHYNSFTTPFLVDTADFPLAEDDPRRRTKEAGYLRRDLKCWRCGRNFGNKFAELKRHLDTEFEDWRRV